MACQIVSITAVFVLCLALTNAQVVMNTCAVCTSETDPNCLFRPQLISAMACPNVAAGVAANCFTRLNGVHTVRGCLAVGAEQQNCQNDVNCTDCSNVQTANDVCNRNTIAPVNRVRCHTCHGSRFGACGVSLQPEPVIAEAQFCPEFVANEQRCFTRRSERFITRGCVSNMTFCSDPAQCLFCSGEGCNSLPHGNEAIPMASSADILNLVPLMVLGAAALSLLKMIKF